MHASLIQIGNSRGLRIPKAVLELAEIDDDVDIRVTKKGITITPLPRQDESEALLYASVRSGAFDDWFVPEEDEAWKDL